MIVHAARHRVDLPQCLSIEKTESRARAIRASLRTFRCFRPQRESATVTTDSGRILSTPCADSGPSAVERSTPLKTLRVTSEVDQSPGSLRCALSSTLRRLISTKVKSWPDGDCQAETNSPLPTALASTRVQPGSV